MLRVGLDLLHLNPAAGGMGTYVRELIPALFAVEPRLRLTAFVSRELPQSYASAAWSGEIDWVHLPVTLTHGPPGNFAAVCGARWVGIPLLAARRRLDVVHGTANVAPLVQPRAATAVTVHDVIWMRFPDTMEAPATRGMKITTVPSARRADRVLCVSESAKAEVVTALGLDPDRVDVTPLGVRMDEPVMAASEGHIRSLLRLQDARVLLCVAQKRPHKNLANLVRALSGLDEDVVLVLVGERTPHEDRLRELAVQLGVEARVRFTEGLSRERLEGVYSVATAFVLPSLMEGFGLPILEAMRRDVPVACSGVSALPEAAGGAAELFDPHDVDAIRTAVTRLIADPRRRAELIALGRDRCRQATWEATARATLASYDRAIAGRRRT